MRAIRIAEHAGSFAENKDEARRLREEILLPTLRKHEEIELDFGGVEGATQSFVHALLSEVLRDLGSEALDQIAFKNCNETVKKIITIVIEYLQEGML